MKSLKHRDALILLLSAIFSVALIFAFTEIPRLLDSLLQKNVGFPGTDPGSSDQAAFQMEIFISATGLRSIGYICLALILLLIILGFVTRRTGWAIGGALITFLPVFGGFALSMFYLAGLGVLRSGLLPLMDISPGLIELGDLIYLPYWILIRFFFLFDYFAHKLLVWTFMSGGALIFTWSVFTWIQTRSGKKGVVTGLLYRYSRHPQYLGWIIWSYGYFIYSCALNQMKKSWWIDPTISWLVMTMIILAICMLEEMKMKDKYGNEYENYRMITPFLFPIPVWLKKILQAPGRLIIRKEHPEKRSEIGIIIIAYTVIIMLLSIPFMNVRTYGYPTFFNRVRDSKSSIGSILEKIDGETDRRTLSTYFNQLESHGPDASEALTGLLKESDPVKREFASNLFGRIGDSRAGIALLEALGDSVPRVNDNIIYALGNMGMESSVQPILSFFKTGRQGAAARNAAIATFGKLGSEEAWDFILVGYHDTLWYNITSALLAMSRINLEWTLPYLFESLEHENHYVRRTSVSIILEKLPAEAIPYLEKVLKDEDFETRFYAKQALKRINRGNEK